MQINGITTSLSLPVEKTNLTQSGKVASDEAVMNFSPVSFTSLVKQAGQFPEVRSELVESYKARAQSGAYPSQDVVDGLSHVLSGVIAGRLNSGSDS